MSLIDRPGPHPVCDATCKTFYLDACRLLSVGSYDVPVGSSDPQQYEVLIGDMGTQSEDIDEYRSFVGAYGIHGRRSYD